jgi:hypothetical protein
VWNKRPTATSGSSGSFTLVQRIQAAGGLLRTNIPMRHTVLRIALTNKKQARGRGGGCAVYICYGNTYESRTYMPIMHFALATRHPFARSSSLMS